MNLEGKEILVTGGNGFLGRHVCDELERKKAKVWFIRSEEFDLRLLSETKKIFNEFTRIHAIIHLAANVGGIGYNQKHPYSIYYDNLIMGTNLIDQSIKHGIEKFVQVGTVCSYPKFTTTPFKEIDLWDGYPEETNAPYGIAKKALLAQLQAARQEFGFNGIYIIPTNLYGPGDEFEPNRSHVIPALIKKFYTAKLENIPEVEVWGSGSASREFLYVKDAAKAIVGLTEKFDNHYPINIGTNHEVRIVLLVDYIKRLIGYEGHIKWNTAKPDGQPKRRVSNSRMKDILDWVPDVDLMTGLKETIKYYEGTLI